MGDTCNVNALNLLQLAPGGHVGRFIVWTKSAFEQLPKIFGGFDEKSETKKGYTLPRPTVALSDVQRVLASAEVKKACRDRKKNSKHVRRHTNPFRNTTALKRSNPLFSCQRSPGLVAFFLLLFFLLLLLQNNFSFLVGREGVREKNGGAGSWRVVSSVGTALP